MSAKSISPNRWQHIGMNLIQSSKLFVIITKYTKYIITNALLKQNFICVLITSLLLNDTIGNHKHTYLLVEYNERQLK